MELFAAVSEISLFVAILLSIYIGYYVYKYPQPMKIMNIVWPLTVLWSGVLGFWAFFAFGRSKEHDMENMGGSMKNMPETSNFAEKVALSTFHCGAGCTLADIIGESLGRSFLPLSGLSGIIWMWALDYILALIIGAYFQYAAIRPMLSKETSGDVFIKALKIDFWSLTFWQIGMYFSSYLFLFVFFQQQISHLSLSFWFVMQIAMCAGFLFAYPINWFLIRKGVKPAM